jgi:hypothetical protein
MSTHGTIKYCGNLPGLADPDLIEGEGIQFEINVPEFLWADDTQEAMEFLDRVIKRAQAGKRKLRKLGKRKAG